ncbi:MAG: ChaN family lipoprotein [Pseudomonadota bacterium]
MTVFSLTKGPLIAGLFVAAGSVQSSEIGIADLIDLPPADVIFLGEIHDNPTHHLNQATAVAALKPAALVFEMFGPDEALAATPEVRSSVQRLEQTLGWSANGWPEFAMYYPIFVAAPEAAIFGGSIDRQDVRRAMSDGAAAVFGSGAPLFGLDQPLAPEEQSAREVNQMAAHCNALPEGMLPGMVEAQQLRDAGLARAIIAALAETGGPVAVITGNGHARKDWAIPRMLSRARPETRILSIAQFESPRNSAPYDYWMVTAAIDRPDPCLAFGIGD